MTICSVCSSGDPIKRPGSVASGILCQGCGNRLIPEKAPASEPVAVAPDNKLQQALDANKTIQGSLYDARKQLELQRNEAMGIRIERDQLKIMVVSLNAELFSIKAALKSAGLPEPPRIAPPAPQAVDFHGVPILNQQIAATPVPVIIGNASTNQPK